MLFLTSLIFLNTSFAGQNRKELQIFVPTLPETIVPGGTVYIQRLSISGTGDYTSQVQNSIQQGNTYTDTGFLGLTDKDKGAEYLSGGLSTSVFSVGASESNADYIFGGTFNIEKSSKTEECKVARRDSDGNLVKDSNGNTVYDVKTKYINSVETTFSWQLTSSEQVAASGRDNSSTSTSSCGDRSKLESWDDMIDTTATRVSRKSVDEFVPSYQLVRIPINGKILKKDYKADKDLKKGFKMAQSGYRDRATCEVQKYVQKNPYTVGAVYLYGALLESQGHLDAATSAYERAVKINNKYQHAAEGTKRSKNRKAHITRYESAYNQSYTIPASFDISICDQIEKQRKKLELSQATQLLSAPETSSTVLVNNLPKGMAFTPTDEKDGYIKLQTIDGIEGWVLKGKTKKSFTEDYSTNNRKKLPNQIVVMAGMPGVTGVGYQRNFTQNFALGANVGIDSLMGSGLTALMLNSKFYLFNMDKFAPYVEVSAGYTPWLYGFAATEQVGVEFRFDAGFTTQVVAGLGQNYDVYDEEIYPFVSGGLNMGWSF